MRSTPDLPSIGIGTDVHVLAPDRPMWLAGLLWPEEPAGLVGHSDGDVVAHAVCDALLSAAGLGDLGSVIGTAERRWAGAHGVDLVAECARRVAMSGYAVANVAVQLVGNTPRLVSRRTEAQAVLGDACGARVTLSATSTDGLGLTGRGEGLAAVGTALLVPLG